MSFHDVSEIIANFIYSLSFIFIYSFSSSHVCLLQEMNESMIMVFFVLVLFQLETNGKALNSSDAIASMIKTAALAVTVLAALLYVSYYVEGSWNFLYCTYGFM